jgi:sucrose-6-phosphate hydrolase SacC (GH32 family)
MVIPGRNMIIIRFLSPGINDFRDPKVRWYDAAEKWIMTLAVKDHIRFYSHLKI